MSRLYGERIVLREYQDVNLEYMKNWVNDPDITANLSDLIRVMRQNPFSKRWWRERLQIKVLLSGMQHRWSI